MFDELGAAWSRSSRARASRESGSRCGARSTCDTGARSTSLPCPSPATVASATLRSSGRSTLRAPLRGEVRGGIRLPGGWHRARQFPRARRGNGPQAGPPRRGCRRAMRRTRSSSPSRSGRQGRPDGGGQRLRLYPHEARQLADRPSRCLDTDHHARCGARATSRVDEYKNLVIRSQTAGHDRLNAGGPARLGSA